MKQSMLAHLFGNRCKLKELVPANAGQTHPPGGSSAGWQPGDLILDRYRVLQTMSGAMGNVYISEHLGWATKIVIKAPRREVLADREGVKCILREAHGWIRMGMHPNVATCYYVLTIEKIPHLFVEYVDGGSLVDWLRAGRCRDQRLALSLAVQFCHGMEFTHSHGIIHRDIKPANVLITKSSLLKITDFGTLLAVSKKDGALAGGNEEYTVGFRGSPGFASPEQFDDAHGVDHRTDIFSFGICLWLMLCGLKPFRDNSISSPIPEPVPIDPRFPFPPLLIDILKRCVAYDPAERFQDFASLREALNTVYEALFKVPCPYANLPCLDLRADNLNNRAVSLFELNKASQAAELLKKALEINDVLPEAIHNLILLEWWNDLLPASRAVRKLDAALKRLGEEPGLLALRARLDFLASGAGKTGKESRPQFRLCPPQSSLAIFRQGQLYQSSLRSMLNHLENGRLEACQEVLLASWRHNHFKKDKTLNQIYERLLVQGRKQKVEGAQRLAVLAGEEQPAGCLSYVPFSRKVVIGGARGQLFLFDFVQKKQIRAMGEPGLPVHCLAVNSTGHEMAMGAGDGSISSWSIDSGRRLGSRSAHSAAVTALAYSFDGRWLLSGAEDGSLSAAQAATGSEMRYSAEGGAVRALVVGRKDGLFITGSDDGNIRFWSTERGSCLKVAAAHELPVRALSASSDGQRLVSGSDDRLLKVWDLWSGDCLRTIEAHEEPVTSVLMLADGAHVVSGSEDDIIRTWNIESGECQALLDGMGEGIVGLAPGPKPHMFLAGWRDGTVVLFTTIYSLAFEP